MKTQKFFIGLIAIFSLVVSTTFASENKTATTAHSEIKSNLNDVMKMIPFEEFMGNEKECKMTIVFHVNENSELVNYKISSNNESLNHITEILLKEADLTTDPVLNGQGFRVEVKFVNKAYHW